MYYKKGYLKKCVSKLPSFQIVVVLPKTFRPGKAG